MIKLSANTAAYRNIRKWWLIFQHGVGGVTDSKDPENFRLWLLTEWNVTIFEHEDHDTIISDWLGVTLDDLLVFQTEESLVNFMLKWS